MKFRKKPVVIEAWQWDGDNHPDGWFVKAQKNMRTLEIVPDSRRLLVDGLEGTMEASVGDWIITGIAGEVYPYKPDIFAATYEAVEC